MSTTAPKPPTKRLLLTAGLTAGATIGTWVITGIGHFVFSGIPAHRIPVYIGLGVIGIIASACLFTRYAIQKHRRDAWWEGFSASDEPAAEVIELRDFRRDGNDTRGFGTGSTS
ncbi:hypothetical protein [Micromonospora sp. URMC 103]|uniref:hypothetical protein n=1 Tax=Micromonospora sp. URMC 103 TaxID=3423406 RepID=UPI003F1E1F82